MCTAISLTAKGHYFGRNLDLDCSYGEQVCVLPRRYSLTFRRMGAWKAHYAMIGMAAVLEGTPLFYDGVNEKGLCMAGLNFPGNAVYHPEAPDRDNVSPFEFIPWVLGQCADLAEARALLARVNLVNLPFSDRVPLSPLHWMVSDGTGSLVVESTAEGLHVYENPAGVLTNNPPFPYQLFHLNNYRGLGVSTPENTFAEGLNLDVYCQGLGGLGLPGDASSMSRFVRAVFHAANAVCGEGEAENVGQFFHILDAVQMVRGTCRTEAGHWDITVYSSCMNAALGRYYYTTYSNRQISCVDMRRENLDGEALLTFPLALEQAIRRQNG